MRAKCAENFPVHWIGIKWMSTYRYIFIAVMVARFPSSKCTLQWRLTHWQQFIQWVLDRGSATGGGGGGGGAVPQGGNCPPMIWYNTLKYLFFFNCLSAEVSHDLMGYDMCEMRIPLPHMYLYVFLTAFFLGRKKNVSSQARHPATLKQKHWHHLVLETLSGRYRTLCMPSHITFHNNRTWKLK